jgi:hypothetical protein
LAAVFAQIFRNWMMLHAVGVDASFDAIAVLIAVVTAAAAGLLLTATGTAGGLCFVAWGGADRLQMGSRRAAPGPT